MIRMSALARMLVLTSLILFGGSGTAFSKCAELLEGFNQAFQQRHVEKLLQLEQHIAVDAVCGRHLVEVQRRRAALQLQLASEMVNEGRSTAEYEPVIIAADQPEVLWHAAHALGNLRFEQQRFVDAAIAYDRALEIIKNASKTPRAPDTGTTKAISERVIYSRQLAATQAEEGKAPAFVPAARNRDGTVGGIFSPNIRGFTPTSVPLPITFHTAQTTFTDVGEAAAQEFLTAIREQKPKSITIVGHADERGPHDYNLQLSADRARAVEQYLRDNGVTAAIVTSGKGWTEPLELPADIGLSPEQIWALNRRVEWRRD